LKVKTTRLSAVREITLKEEITPSMAISTVSGEIPTQSKETTMILKVMKMTFREIKTRLKEGITS